VPPLTLAAHLVQGSGGSTDYLEFRAWVARNPELAHELLDKLTCVSIGYVRMQVEAGAQAIQGAAVTPRPFGIEIFTERTVVRAPIRLQLPGRSVGVRPAANCSTIRAQNAGRSSGQRLEVMF
jgi:Uroporphyrinogen decarboxylase (URO-D)